MAALIESYMKLETLETIVSVLKAKNEKGVKMTIALNNEQDTYGNNCSMWVSQSKEDREAGKKKFYTGNGKVLWTDGQITKSEKDQPKPTSKKIDTFDDTPF